MRRFKLFIIWLKASFKCVVKGLLISAVFFVAGVITVNSFMGKEGDEADQNAMIKGAIVTDDDRFYDILHGLITDIPGVNGLCGFDRMSMEEAQESLVKGECGIVIGIPEDFYEKAQSMEEAQLKIYTSKSPSGSVQKLLAMIGSAQTLVNITDAQILSMYEGLEQYDLSVDRHAMEDTLYYDSIDRFMSRDELIGVTSVSAYGNYTIVGFYITTIVIILLMLLSVPMLRLYDRETMYLQTILNRGALAAIPDMVIKTAAIWIPLGAAGELICNLLNLYLIKISLMFVPDLRFHICLWLGALSLALWVNLVGTVLSSDNAHFRVVYILSSLIMMTASGVMVPAVYLPDMLRKISGVIPTGALHGMLMSGFWESAGIREPGDIPGLTVTLITDAAVLLFSMIFATGRDRK